jgi:aryl carrier-like protein
LEEIEAVLATNPVIRQAVVVERDGRLVAFYAPASVQTAAVDFRQYLRQWLPEYMIPQQYVEITAFPLTSSGKVDRRALLALAPAAVTEVEGGGKTLPRTTQERVLADICGSVLRQDAVFADDNLFDLGLDSLRLFQIVARAKDQGLHLTAKQILVGQSVAGICSKLASAEEKSEGNGPVLAPVQRDKYRFRRTGATGVTNNGDG